MGGVELRHWGRSWGFTHTEAAKALGIGRSSYCNYIARVRVPDNVRLATIGYDATQQSRIDNKYKLLKSKFDRITLIMEEEHGDE